jgi:hypothetical protein
MKFQALGKNAGNFPGLGKEGGDNFQSLEKVRGWRSNLWKS